QAWLTPGAAPGAVHPADTLWLVGYISVAMAALRQWGEPVTAADLPAENHDDQGLVPWLSVLGIYVLLALVFAPDAAARERGVLMGVIATTGLILLRQAI